METLGEAANIGSGAANIGGEAANIGGEGGLRLKLADWKFVDANSGGFEF